MHLYNVGAPFERIVIDIAGPFPRIDQENRYLLIAMDYFTKWPEAYAIPSQEASTVAEALVTNFFCRFGVPRELHSDQGRNFESRLIQVLKRLGHDIHNYALQHLKLVSNRMKTPYNRLASCAGYHEGDKMWLYSPTRRKGKSPKLQSSCEGSYKVVTRINDVVYRIQRNPRSRFMVVYLDRLASGNRLGRAVLKREPREQLESNHSENRATGNKGETDHRRHKHCPRKRRNGGTPVGHSGRMALRREKCGV
jgi:hypothetical protein